jgi:magnesium-transporting ATPase (P-type)
LSRPDGRILTSATLEIDESALTGESLPVPKQTAPVAADSALGDRVDLAFMNTQVTRGAGTMVVTGTGMTTEVGHISGMLQASSEEETPLTRQLNKLTNQILIIAGLALAASIGIGLWRNTPFDELFLTAIAFSVSAIPTGLPAVVTAVLSAGTQKLAAAGAIVKRLRSVETLGSTSAINSDKTGTLTLNQMTGGPDGGRRPALRDLRRGLLDGRPDHPRRRPAARPARRAAAADGALRRRRGQGRQARRRPDRGRASSFSRPRAASTRR